MIKKIVSGGQTGVDRAALDVALEKGIPCGGWVSKGRLAEDGVIPVTYPNLQETESENPEERTAFNIRDADATLLVTRGKPVGGSLYTLDMAARMGKPLFHIDLEELSLPLAIRLARDWLERMEPSILNIAGSRSSEDQEIYRLAHEVLSRILETLRK